ncbi:hypothetical protein PIB30_006281 [Stylosanthes scabra]|uniref:PB1 domain-containing protein n=1 Tax=Stylosanthes scabra TaxID=79078 RepID=A0ABU6Q4B9_9FABA|nr:hypothetical protein [Stylosanthes scabra]
MEIKRAKFICSYGGEIKTQGRNELTYVGGTNKLVYVDRRIDFAGMLAYICDRCRLDCNGYNFKYQIPDGNILVPVTNDRDLNNLMVVYDRFNRAKATHMRPSARGAYSQGQRFSAFKDALLEKRIGIAPEYKRKGSLFITHPYKNRGGFSQLWHHLASFINSFNAAAAMAELLSSASLYNKNPQQ